EVAGSQKLSKHSQGLAVDINTLYNPCVANRQGRQTVQPQAGRPYAFRRDQRQDIPYKIDHNDLAYKLFRAEGFTWGGDWRTVKDYQHFEYN
ncbi:MAG: M15 family metallopeptidase, partial [Bacteroidaceae bacterium]|nr:M15 family metallopeptidase [Bacteroidaceae bacterium]